MMSQYIGKLWERKGKASRTRVPLSTLGNAGESSFPCVFHHVKFRVKRGARLAIRTVLAGVGWAAALCAVVLR
jgi:3-oxoacyl-[acyl-carrier-protein] synthase III